MRLPKDTVKEVIAEFGYDRVNFVLANSVQRKDHDGRFFRENKEWAKGKLQEMTEHQQSAFSMGGMEMQ